MLEMTSDVDETLTALGYDKYSVWGVSFGTLMAQGLAKRFPDRVESIVLDSPASLYEDEDFPSLSQSISISVLSAVPDALELVFAECAADPTCNESYPDLAQTLSDTMAALEKQPLEFTTERDGATYTWSLTPSLFYGQLGNSMGAELIGFVPRVIHAVARRVTGDPEQDEEGLAALQQAVEASFDPGLDGAEQTDALFGTVSCSSWNYVDEEEVEAAAEDPFVREHMLDLVLAGVRDCKEAWQVPSLEEIWPEMLTPLESDTLTALILPGKFDANIPPLTGELIESHLEHGYLHVTPDRGHVVINDCTTAMTQAFLRDPTTDPDASCLDELAIDWQ
jgi:pimeloyl-ACP methyl ester carboxylesterase